MNRTIPCQDCADGIPLTFGSPEIGVGDHDQRVARVRVQDADLWAHAWTHDEAAR